MFFKSNKNNRKAFTLAEVLITLSIIGVISVMTIPVLISHYQKTITETRLKAFYSNMSNAVAQWLSDENMEPKDVNYRNINSSQDFLTWWNNNIGKQLQVSRIETLGHSKGNPAIGLTMLDGSAANVYINHPGEAGAAMHFFFCAEKRFCQEERVVDDADGRRSFLFTLEDGQKDPNGGRFVSSYTSGYHNMSRAELLNHCRTAQEKQRFGCTRLIEMDGWKIKSDYPWFH